MSEHPRRILPPGSCVCRKVLHAHTWSSQATFRLTRELRAASLPYDAFTIKDGRLVEVSQHFPVFYRKQMEAETSRVPLKEKDFDICREMATDKLKRLARINDRAGFQTALSWMHADDTSTREKAVSVFGDIRDAPALEALKKMTKDQDRLVAEEATMQIKNIETRDPSVDQPGFVGSIKDKP